MSDTDMDELSGRTGFEELRYRPQRASIQKPYAGESGFMPARRRYAGYLDDADGAKIGDGRVQVA